MLPVPQSILEKYSTEPITNIEAPYLGNIAVDTIYRRQKIATKLIRIGDDNCYSNKLNRSQT